MLKRGKVNNDFREGAKAGVPIVIGYVPIAMAFGILSKTTGISMLDSFLFSLMVFAGASQFMALNLLAIGAGMGEIILTTLLVNLRHFLMSASLAARMKGNIKRWIPLIAFGVTDESFSVLSFKEGDITKDFTLGLQLTAYISWVVGTVLGYLAGGLLPQIVSDGMGIALYAMFVAILVPELKKSNKVVILVLLSGATNTLLNYFEILPKGWNMILTIILVSSVGAYLYGEDYKEEVNVCE